MYQWEIEVRGLEEDKEELMEIIYYLTEITRVVQPLKW